MIRILLVDDLNLVRLGIQALLDQDKELKIIGAVRDGRSAIAATNRLKPDVVLIDIEMPGMNGITATKYISQLAPKTKVIILSSHEDTKYVMQALLAGAKGYLLKDSLLNNLRQAIIAVQNGYSQVDSKLLAEVFNPERIKSHGTLQEEKVSQNKNKRNKSKRKVNWKRNNLSSRVVKTSKFEAIRKILSHVKLAVFSRVKKLHQGGWLWKIGLFVLGIIIFLVVREF